ncbi:hypothetical protein A4X13_0g6376 [Tilletia indica]|uniref:Reverse transcriptase n=1 Tax=Tilletia indica TaxID=43049 RepID=A0A177T5E6_9BASI|nr:hypothetical protein A4X13_0g6376 [Tilletia indica]
MSNSDPPARNTRSQGPSLDEFRALEESQASLRTTVESHGGMLQQQSDDLAELKRQAARQSEQFSRLERDLAELVSFKRAEATAKVEADVTSSGSAAVSNPESAGVATLPPSSTPSKPEASASQTNTKTYNIKSEDIGTFDGTPENLELWLARVQAIRFAENDAAWDRAVLRAIPLALRGRAAMWHSALTDPQRAGLFKIDKWFEALRQNFSPQPAVVRIQARIRAWEPDLEDILSYALTKTALLKIGYPSMTEGDVVLEVSEKLPVEIQMLLQQPRQPSPSLEKLREELRIQEAFWRQKYGRPLRNPSVVGTEVRSESPRVVPFSQLLSPPAARPIMMAIEPAQQTQRSRFQSVAQQRGKEYDADFDPSRLGRGINPRTKNERMSYRVPDTTRTIWYEVETPSLYLADRPQLHTPRHIDVAPKQRLLDKPPRRVGTVVHLPDVQEVGTGQTHRRHVPLTTHIHINDVKAPPTSSLLDTGSSLSIIDATLLQKLGGTVTGQPMHVKGIGGQSTLGWTTITFFIPAQDTHGYQLSLECTLDFHVLPEFAPGLCLGQDFIQSQNVLIDAEDHTAKLRRYRFKTHAHVPQPFAAEASLCSTAPVFLPARSMAWVPVDVGALAMGIDYTIHPRWMHDEDEKVIIAGPNAVGSKECPYVLLANYGTRSATLPRRTPIADAVAAQVGDQCDLFAPDHDFSLHSPMSPAEVNTLASDPGVWTAPDEDASSDPLSSVAEPLDLFEGTDELGSSLASDAATVLVDGHYRVGVDASGAPHPRIVDLLRRHSGAFALDGRPGLIRDAEMEIKLDETAPLRSEPPRRASPEKRKAMDTAIDQLLEWNVIEPSSSPVSFPVLMVRQYGKWRFCVDYRQLNAVTVADRYPLPITDAVFQTLQGKKWFSSLDAIRGYHQHPVRPADRWKTAFVCHRGLYQYRTVPFGLRNAPAVFQRLMDRVLGELRWRTAVVYIDDVVAATADLDEHLATLEVILTRAEAIGLKFSPAKCTFGVPSLTLLGRKVSGAGVAVWGDRAKAVQDLSPPKTLRDLYHVLGLFGYYRMFIDRFAAIAEPLTRLTRGWRYESVGDRTRLVRKDGTPATAEHELLAWTDEQQSSFERLKSAVASPPVLAHPDPGRPYILYVDASKAAFAAVVHQVFSDEELTALAPVVSMPASAALLPSAPVSRARWSNWLRADRLFGPILRQLESDPNASAEWVLEAGVLARRADGRWALPDAALPLVLKALHDDNGHFGYTKTYLAVSRHFWRPRLTDAIRAWVRHCRPCQQTKLARRVGELDVDNDAVLPFEDVSFDLVLGLPRTRSGNTAALVILCLFPRMVIIHPCPATIDAKGICAIISDRILRLGWRPRRLITDSEARVTGQTMQELAASLRAEMTPSAPHHQQANAVERAVQTVQHALKTLSVSESGSWDKKVVPAVELAINSTPSVSTGYRPFDMVFISHPTATHAVFDDGSADPREAFSDRLAAASDRLEDAFRAIRESRSRQKQRYDASRRPLPSLRVGDEVYVRLADRPIPGLGVGKLDASKAGPWRVKSVLSPHRVRLELPEEFGISDEFSVDQLDTVPRSPDRFADVRNPLPPDAPIGSPPGPPSPASVVELDEEGVVEVGRAGRVRQPPGRYRDFDVGVAASDSAFCAVHFSLLR